MLPGPRFSGGGFNMSVKNQGGEENHFDNINNEAHYESSDNEKSLSAVSDRPVKYLSKKKAATPKLGQNRAGLQNQKENDNLGQLIESMQLPESITLTVEPLAQDEKNIGRNSADLQNYNEGIKEEKEDTPNEALDVDKKSSNFNSAGTPISIKKVEARQISEVTSDLPPLPENKAEEIESQPSKVNLNETELTE